MILDSMKSELSAWNDGDGIDLQGWISGMGNFKLAVGYTTVFWPEFQELNGYILRSDVTLDSVKHWESVPDRTKKQVECALNHFHIADIQQAFCEDISKDKVIYLGSTLVEIYQAKLSWSFPNNPCHVEFYHPDNAEDLMAYQLTFWQQKHGKL